MQTGKNFWGPSVWATIHTFAAGYHPSQRKHYKEFMLLLTKLLPCEYCRDHLAKNLKNYSIDDYLDNNHSLFLWTYILHDVVNKQLGKKSPPFDKVKAYYFLGMGPECTSCQLK